MKISTATTRTLAGALSLALLGFWSPATALVDIRFERWSLSPTIAMDTTAPVESTTAVGVYFDATITGSDLDPVKGIRFSIAERDPGANQELVRFGIRPCSNLPVPGSTIAVHASFRIYCDRDGILRARDGIEWLVVWCNLPTARNCYSDGPQPSPGLPAVSEPEKFELVVLDENGMEGSYPTPEDALRCRGAGPSEPPTEFVAPDFAESGFIGLYVDAAGTRCDAFVEPLVPFRWYVVTTLEGLTRCGIWIAELGVHELPANFYVNVTPNPAAFTSIGNLFTTAALGFHCERGDGRTVLLYTIEGLTTEPVRDLVLRVESGSPPSNRFWPYPWTETCPEILAARRRMRTVDLHVNPSPGAECNPTVRVEPTTWTRLKALYRDSADGMPR